MPAEQIEFMEEGERHNRTSPRLISERLEDGGENEWIKVMSKTKNIMDDIMMKLGDCLRGCARRFLEFARGEGEVFLPPALHP